MDNILFNVEHIDLTSIEIVKLDDLYMYRPSLYKDSSVSLTDVLKVDKENVDLFDSIFMSAVTSLLLKDIKLDYNFMAMLVTIIHYEIAIIISDDTDTFDKLFRYLLEYQKIITNKFNSIKTDVDDIMDITFTFIENKSLCHAMIAKG